jgi:hypothetical protein
VTGLFRKLAAQAFGSEPALRSVQTTPFAHQRGLGVLEAPVAEHEVLHGNSFRDGAPQTAAPPRDESGRRPAPLVRLVVPPALPALATSGPVETPAGDPARFSEEGRRAHGRPPESRTIDDARRDVAREVREGNRLPHVDAVEPIPHAAVVAPPSAAMWPLAVPAQLLSTARPLPSPMAAPLSSVASHRGPAAPVAGGEGYEIHVHIGRIELTAVHEAPPDRPVPRTPRPEPMSLDDYLARRERRA